jgi:hypothetical protein
LNHDKTFWELISGEYPDSIPHGERDEEFIIDIPIIQRDYAQGRKSEEQRRNLFLQELSDCINERRHLHLEFIYGRVKDEKQDSKSVFSPIDGQQRLTTLYLLHWYTGLKEKIKGKNPESFKKLKNFIYDTRLSSRAFCKAIVEEDIVLPDTAEGSIEKIITSSYWFRDSWNNDPTIKAMLIMIQAIHFMFFNKDEIWSILTKDRIITFYILDMNEKGFTLNDELYIKMNSRGKQLSKFEEFKANFIKFLETEYKDKYFRVSENSSDKESYNDYFSFRIEKQWTDLFWAYRDENVFIIDNYFMNYFEFISQLLYFLDHSGSKVQADDFDVNNFTQIKEIYSNKEPFICNNAENSDRIAFLFKSLDLFYNISLENDKVNKERLNNFFKELFYSSGSENDKVKVNDEGQIFLFERCLKNNLKDNLNNNKFQNKDRIILFSIIVYCLKYNLTKFSDFSGEDYINITHCVRVIRNLLQAQRQRKDIRFEADLSINDFSNYWKLINELLEAEIYKILPGKIPDSSNKINEQLKEEIKKAGLINSSENEIQRNGIQRVLFMLEDFHYFNGLIHVLKVDENKDKLNDYLKAVREIWDNEDVLIIQAMIASGFNGYHVKDCAHGDAEAVYFGEKNNWYYILTNEDKEVAENIIKLLDNFISADNKLSPRDKLNDIISKAITKFTKNNWQYYFLKYSGILDTEKNYFAFYDDFNIRRLGTTGSNPLVANHINAYVRVICNDNEVKNYCKSENECKTNYGNISPLILKNGLELFCEEKGWRLDINKIDSGINAKLQSVMNKYIPNSDNILRDYNGLNRIETVIKFIKEINF